MTTVLDYLAGHAERFPRHFVIAADHTFDCTCTDCLCFLTLTRPSDIEGEDAVLHEDVDLLDGCMSESQKARLHSYLSKVC